MAKNSLSSVYSDTKDQGSKLQKSFLIPVASVMCDWDENIRPLNEDHVASWIHSMSVDDYIPPILVEMKDGEPHVIEGYHRWEAKTRHDPDGVIECKEWKGSAGEKLITMRNSTTGLPLTFLEDAELIAEIKEAEDITTEQLGQRLGISRTAVANKLLIAEADPKVKALIADEVVSATTVIEVIIAHGQDKALVRLEHLIKKAQGKGKSRVTGAGGGTKQFSAAKLRGVTELLTRGLDYEDFITNQETYGDGEVDITLTLDKRDLLELCEVLEEYVEHKA